MTDTLINALRNRRSTFGYMDMEAVMPALVAFVEASEILKDVIWHKGADAAGPSCPLLDDDDDDAVCDCGVSMVVGVYDQASDALLAALKGDR